MAKVKLDTRLEPEIVERLMSLSASTKTSISDILANALDAYDREINSPMLVTERVESLENSVLKLVDVIKDRDANLAVIATETKRIGNITRLTYYIAYCVLEWAEKFMFIMKGKETFDEWQVSKKKILAELQGSKLD